MLILSRKIGERIHIGDDIEVVVSKIHGDRVRIGIVAPKNMSVRRDDIKDSRPKTASETEGKDA